MRLSRNVPGHAVVTMWAVFTVTCAPAAAPAPAGLSPRQFADALHKVMSADRSIYTQKVIQRLTVDSHVATASENFEDDKALPLPAQMFRMGAELVSEDPDAGFSYSLQSLWPINKSNAANQTEAEKKGLQHVVDQRGQNFYTEETLGGKTYYTAVYPDIAVAQACVKCHNEHKDSPRRDFKVGDVMGGVVVRVALSR